MIIAVGAIVGHMVVGRVAIAAAIVAGAEGLVANFPVLDADGVVAVDGEERILGVEQAVGRGPSLVFGTSRGAKLSPIAGGLPVVALLVDAQGNVVGRAIN